MFSGRSTSRPFSPGASPSASVQVTVPPSATPRVVREAPSAPEPLPAPIPVPPVEEALVWLEANPQANRRSRRTVLGTPAEVRRGLDAVAAEYGADELMLVNILPDHPARRLSYELMAAEYGLAPTAAAA